MASTGNTGTATSASQAQSQASTANANASNAANGKGESGNTSTSNNSGSTSTNTSTNTSTGATNSAGLMGSLIGFGNAVAKGEVSGGSSSTSGNSTETSNEAANNRSITRTYAEAVKNGSMSLTDAAVDAANKAYTKARSEGKTEKAAQKEAQKAAAKAYYSVAQPSEWSVGFLSNIKGKNTGPTYNPAVTAQATTNKTIAKGSSEMGPSAPAASVTPSAPSNTAGPAAEGTGTESVSTAPSISDVANTGITNRGGTVANGGGTAVTDSGTGGSISSSISTPSRDASSIGLGVYNTDRANYDQDNWNRGMEAESSSLVSDEECKAFAKRAFLENSEPFKRVRVTIIKKC